MAQMHSVAVVNHYTANPADYTIVSRPQPPSPTALQVLVQVHAASINPLDSKRAEGMLAIPLPEPFPLQLGYDLAGIVAAIGSGVRRFSPGDRVYGRVRNEQAGTVAEFAVTEEENLARIPDTVRFVAAAAVPVAGLAAKQALVRARLQAGDRLVVSGGMGGVGLFAVQLAQLHFGVTDITVTVSADKARKAKELLPKGVAVVEYTGCDYTEMLEDKADVVLDTIGDSAAYKVARSGGRVVSVAMVPDARAIDDFKQPGVALSLWQWLRLLALKCIVACAAWYLTRGFRAKQVEYLYASVVPDGCDLEDSFNPLLEDGRLKVVVTEYPFTEKGVQDAFVELRAGHATGKIVIRVKDD